MLASEASARGAKLAIALVARLASTALVLH